MTATLASQWVAFDVGSEAYAIAIEHVQEIVRLGEPTPIPHAPGYVLGVINLRGRVVPVLDLAARLGLGALAVGRAARIVIIRWDGTTLGLAVDAVTEVLRLAEGAVEDVPGFGAIEGVTGVATAGDRLVILIDPARLVQPAQEEAAWRI